MKKEEEEEEETSADLRSNAVLQTVCLSLLRFFVRAHVVQAQSPWRQNGPHKMFQSVVITANIIKYFPFFAIISEYSNHLAAMVISDTNNHF